MADEEDMICVFILGAIVMIYSILFYVCDEEYRTNFRIHVQDEAQIDTVGIKLGKAKDQFNLMALKFDKLHKVKKKSFAMLSKRNVVTISYSYLDLYRP